MGDGMNDTEHITEQELRPYDVWTYPRGNEHLKRQIEKAAENVSRATGRHIVLLPTLLDGTEVYTIRTIGEPPAVRAALETICITAATPSDEITSEQDSATQNAWRVIDKYLAKQAAD